MRNYTLTVDDNGRIDLVSEKLRLPDLQWSFFCRPICRLSDLAPESIRRGEGEIVIAYRWRELAVRSLIRLNETSVFFSLEIDNLRSAPIEMMLFRLSCRKPEYQPGDQVRFVTFTEGMRAVGEGVPGAIRLPVLAPQVGVLNRDFLAADIDGTEHFEIAVDTPEPGSLSFNFPIEDEFSCGWRKLLPGETYCSDRIMLEFPRANDPAGVLEGLRRVNNILHPPRQSAASRRIKAFYNTWYAYKGGINEAAVREAVDYAAANHLDAVEIDDGYFPEPVNTPPECESRNLATDPAKFPHGFAPLLEYARSKEVELILWCCPYMVRPGDPLGEKHPEALLRRADGTPIYWVNGYLLDPSHPFTAEYLKRFFAHFNAMGFAGYKVDFLGPLVNLQNRHFAAGLTRPGEWARLTWRLIAEAVGPELLIHAATPMSPSPTLWPYLDMVRVWGDNDPYHARGVDGYTAFPFIMALGEGAPTRLDPDMIYPTREWGRLCEPTFQPEQFMDALGSAFVSKACYITEHCGNYDPELREVFRTVMERYRPRDFRADRLNGPAVYRWESAEEAFLFTRRAGTVELPAGRWKGTRIAGCKSYPFEGEGKVVSGAMELLLLRKA